ncbi:MAG: ABC transporter ATP-binding protein [Burkholderiales bacterium]|nr:MAG: multidrug ABC transporter ATP-binding protein [Betaproteobacteria bacterium TMED22]|tara:strand:- start:825 stop:1754 length:930 start_codon:yes stop_codon:yes gene_type:complete
MASIIDIQHLTKKYADGHLALDNISVRIDEGEIIALLGPNGAGKTTLISIICGLTVISGGSVQVDGCDVVSEYRRTRSIIGLVPQELMLEPFETVLGTVKLSRGLFGLKADPAYVEKILRQLSLWTKRNNQIRELSGGMKRRVLIAKALSHEPKVLFLDEPTAGVDVDMRRETWKVIKSLKQRGVTIVLTTHYIEEAEEIADRIAVINNGKILLIEEKYELMKRLGKKQLWIDIDRAITELPIKLRGSGIELENHGTRVVYKYDAAKTQGDVSSVLAVLREEGIAILDLQTYQSSLEDIFVGLVNEETM